MKYEIWNLNCLKVTKIKGIIFNHIKSYNMKGKEGKWKEKKSKEGQRRERINLRKAG
jgi:hypothetical protein